MVPAAEGQPRQKEGLLHLSSVPMATTCAMYDGHIITDPDAEEEALAASSVTSVVDATGALIGSLQSHHHRILQIQQSSKSSITGCLSASTLHAKRCACHRSASCAARESQ